jgi:hypothetical protein
MTLQILEKTHARVVRVSVTSLLPVSPNNSYIHVWSNYFEGDVVTSAFVC